MAEKRKLVQSNKTKRNFKRVKNGGAAKLEAGMKGLLVSHDRNREKSCRIDSFRLLNHFADELYGVEKVEEVKPIADDNDEDDIESALSSEVSEIRDFTKSQNQRRFSTVKSGCNNLIFIRFKDISPGAFMKIVVEKICGASNFEEENIPFIKHVLRAHPVDFSCSAYLDTMCKSIPLFLEKRFKELETDRNVIKQYTIEYKCRNNSHLSRQIVLDGLYEAMKDSRDEWRYNCRSQSLSVIIDVLKTVCLVSVVKNYYMYRKYNIRELLLHKGANKDRESGEFKKQVPDLGDDSSTGFTKSTKNLELGGNGNIYEQALLGSKSNDLLTSITAKNKCDDGETKSKTAEGILDNAVDIVSESASPDSKASV